MDNKLIRISENSFFEKIKSLFCRCFYKKSSKTVAVGNKVEIKNDIVNSIENKEIIELQKLYRKNELNVQELSSEQVLMICNVYDKQIAELKRLNDSKKKKILKYKEKLQVNNY